MSPVGTVIREDHDGGYSIWVLVHRALCQGYGEREKVWRNPEWLCVESTSASNCGSRLVVWERPSGEVIGAVPGFRSRCKRWARSRCLLRLSECWGRKGSRSSKAPARGVGSSGAGSSRTCSAHMGVLASSRCGHGCSCSRRLCAVRNC